ncbi:MAG: phage tail tape measure protein, partial [Rikenellaceae bacterium]
MEINVVFNLLNKSATAFNRIDSGFNQLSQKISKVQGCLWKFNQTAELFDKMGAAVTQITTPFIEFEQSMADLSAITGIAGSELAALGKIAREVGISSGLGATGAVDAFKLLASQIDVSKIGMGGLIELQNKTITLAQASGMSLTDAANSMAGTINQFGLEASEASRVINVLAAGSKYGAAEIPELAMSFKVVGAAANAAGLSVEQTAGAIEVLSKNNLKGAEAGTALRNIMLKMQTSMGIDFRNTTLTEALDKLRPKLRDATYLSSLFGMENVAAAQFLITNADAVKEMTDRVTNTSVATEQAAISTDTWSHRLKIQTAYINDTFMTITENSKGILNFLQLGSNLSNIFLSFSPLLSAIGSGFKAVGAGLSGVNNVLKATKALTIAMRAGDMIKYAEAVKSYGIAGRIASAGVWMKTIAVKAFSIASRATIPALIGMVAQTWAW